MQMTAKRALVVDDSKSARVVLSRMLEKYGISVDTADSAESALDYMKDGRPDVIFMDHLMPGMDGLQAVQILKADPATAAIPVVMYTSQEGELYVGQAKAMGAVGVLPKTVKPIDVTKILYQLRLLPDRRDSRPSSLQPVDEQGEPRSVSVAEVAPDGSVDPRTRGFVEAMLKEQSLELRRFMVATLDSHAQRLIAELKPAAPEPVEATLPPSPVEPARPWGWIAAFAASVAALLVLAGLYWQSLDTARDVEQARARLEQESTALRSTLAEVRDAGRRPLPAAADAPRAAASPRVEVLQVPYGEVPLSAGRLDAVRSLVASLETGGFAGAVTVETVAGVFCLNGDAEEGFSLAPPDQPARECDLRGNPFDESLAGAARQPVAFANLARSLERRTEGRIQLTLVQGSPDHQVAPYPALRQSTAGAWNEAAQANNRLEISVRSR
jgi:CheY-like chemotaxis protein